MAIRREITTSKSYDDQVTELMARRGVSRSEAYRHIQNEANGRSSGRNKAGQLLAEIKTHALAIDRESSGRHAERTQSILRAAADLLAVI